MARADYGELPPPAPLADRVQCLWWVRPADAGRGAAILPDGVVDLVWHGGQLTIAGPDLRVRRSGSPPGATTLGVRLRPGAAQTLGLPASELLDRQPVAEEVWGAAGRRLAEQLSDAVAPRDALAAMTAAVAGLVRDAPSTDPVVDAAVLALRRPGSTVAEVARDVGVGERTLRRRFVAHVGYGPKHLQRVLRLQRFLALAVAGDDDLSGLAALAGYADQAHMTRETRDLADATPALLVADRRG